MTERRFTGTRLGRVIEKQGRTKRWVAGQAGFSESMLAHVIAGRKTIGETAARAIATAIGVDFCDLFESADADAFTAIKDEAA